MSTSLLPATLTGKLVQLEPLTAAHADELVELALAAPPETFRFMPMSFASRAHVAGLVEAGLDRMRADVALVFATRARTSGTLVGSTSIFAVDPDSRRVEIGGTWVAPAAQRTGVNVEAKLLQLGHCFEALQALRVELKTDALNVRSRAAITAMGATEEGTLRSHMVCHDGRVRDSVYFSILEREWPRVRARLEERLRRGAH